MEHYSSIKSAIITTSIVLDNTLSPIQAHENYYEYASPLDIGLGHINPNQALDPGLIYKATVQDYVNLLCSLNHTRRHIIKNL